MCLIQLLKFYGERRLQDAHFLIARVHEKELFKAMCD